MTVTAREALVDGGLSMASLGGGKANEGKTYKTKGKRKGGQRNQRATSLGLRRNALPERLAGSGHYDIRTSTSSVTRRMLAESLAEVRRLRPELPVRAIVDGVLVTGLEVTAHEGGYLIGCVSIKHWSRNLLTAGFPDGVRVTPYGVNGILIEPNVNS